MMRMRMMMMTTTKESMESMEWKNQNVQQRKRVLFSITIEQILHFQAERARGGRDRKTKQKQKQKRKQKQKTKTKTKRNENYSYECQDSICTRSRQPRFSPRMMRCFTLAAEVLPFLRLPLRFRSSESELFESVRVGNPPMGKLSLCG